MIEKKDYKKILDEFNFLKFFPNDKEKMAGQYNSLKYSGIDDREVLLFAFNKWCELGNDEFPSFLDLKKMITPQLKQYSAKEVLWTFHKEGTELYYVREWIEANCDLFQRPSMSSFDQQRLTIAQSDKWAEQDQDAEKWAMIKFHKYFKENPNEVKSLLEGGLVSDNKALEWSGESLGIDLSKIGRIES